MQRHEGIAKDGKLFSNFLFKKCIVNTNEPFVYCDNNDVSYSPTKCKGLTIVERIIADKVPIYMSKYKDEQELEDACMHTLLVSSADRNITVYDGDETQPRISTRLILLSREVFRRNGQFHLQPNVLLVDSKQLDKLKVKKEMIFGMGDMYDKAKHYMFNQLGYEGVKLQTQNKLDFCLSIAAPNDNFLLFHNPKQKTHGIAIVNNSYSLIGAY